jgi:glutamine synthetase
MADAIEAGASPQSVASDTLRDNWRCIFNGDNYSAEWPIEAEKRGVWRIDSGVESMARMSAPKNIELFSSMNVATAEECVARTTGELHPTLCISLTPCDHRAVCTRLFRRSLF